MNVFVLHAHARRRIAEIGQSDMVFIIIDDVTDCQFIAVLYLLRSSPAQQLDIKDQRRVWGNQAPACAPLAIRQGWRDDQNPLAALLQRHYLRWMANAFR
jgi:hypothetical protein